MSAWDEFQNLVLQLEDGSVDKAKAAVGPAYQRLKFAIADFELAAKRLREAMDLAQPVIDLFNNPRPTASGK
jgi:chemotaxis regulatin CheY-phosphate phosphatase CheZ